LRKKKKDVESSHPKRKRDKGSENAKTSVAFRQEQDDGDDGDDDDDDDDDEMARS